MSEGAPLILASASPRRRRILAEIGVPFEVVVPEADEVFLGDDPGETARENALRKHDWSRGRFPERDVIAADTVIDLDGRCVTKPSSRQHAIEMLRSFSGRDHTVITAVAFSRPHTGTRLHVDEASVRFRAMDDATIARYFALVDPMDKAGSYDIGRCSDIIIESFSGSWTCIMGLPLEVVVDWLRATPPPGRTAVNDGSG